MEREPSHLFHAYATGECCVHRRCWPLSTLGLQPNVKVRVSETKQKRIVAWEVVGTQAMDWLKHDRTSSFEVKSNGSLILETVILL